MATDNRPPLRRLLPRSLDCGACGASVEAEDATCGRCGAERPITGWKPGVGVRVAGGADRPRAGSGTPRPGPGAPRAAPAAPRVVPPAPRAVPPPRAVPAGPRAAAEAAPRDERADRPAPLRLRMRPAVEDGVLDEFDFAAEVVDVSRPTLVGDEEEHEPVRELVPGRIYAGRYRVEETLSKAPCADRYAAIQEPLVRRVVLTILRADLQQDAQQTLEARFLREAGVLSRMRHPSLAPVHEAGRAPDGTCFATEELLYGFTLRELVDRGSLAPERLVAIGADIAGALAALHEAGIAHRCLRADQVVIGPRIWRGGAGAEVAQLGRYGLEVTPEAVVENEDAESAVAWPPEVHGGQEPDEAADIYAVGVILYRALAGRAPYEGTASQIMGARALGDPPPLARDGDGGLADKLRDVADRCLQAAPERRYLSARLLLAELEALAQAPPKPVVVAPAPAPAALAVPTPAAPATLPLRGAVFAAIAGALVPTAALLALLVIYPTWWGLPETPAVTTRVVYAPAPAPAPAAPVAAPAVEAAPPAPVTTPEPAQVAVAPTAVPVAPAPATTSSRRSSGARAPTSAGSTTSSARLAAVAPSEPAPATSAPVAPAAATEPGAPAEPAAVAPVVAAPAPQPAPAAIVEAPAAAEPRAAASAEVPGAAALTGLWLGKVSGGSFALDLSVGRDGRVTGRARRSDGAKEGVVAGRVSTSEEGLRVELQVTEGSETTSYSGVVVDGELRGRIYAGGKAQGRFTAQR